MAKIEIRHVQQGDLAPLLEIYNHYVRETPVTFDIEPRTLAQRKSWLDGFSATGRYQCFVAVKNGEPIGWASSHRFHERAAYDTSILSSVYLAPSMTGQGLGRRLYVTLFDALKREDIHRVCGSITLPNVASVGLHLALGFQPAGNYPELGRKFGRFWDVATYMRSMPQEGAVEP